LHEKEYLQCDAQNKINEGCKKALKYKLERPFLSSAYNTLILTQILSSNITLIFKLLMINRITRYKKVVYIYLVSVMAYDTNVLMFHFGLEKIKIWRGDKNNNSVSLSHALISNILVPGLKYAH
jgi:hypothetical protein